jgi:tetratricopeptide (TPR) repeat protein
MVGDDHDREAVGEFEFGNVEIESGGRHSQHCKREAGVEGGEEALAELTALTRIQPDDLAAQVGAAQCLIPLGRPAEAAAILEKVVEVAPNYVLAYLQLGLAYRVLGKTAEARSAWEEVLRLDPGNPAARALLSQLGPPTSPSGSGTSATPPGGEAPSPQNRGPGSLAPALPRKGSP